MHRPPGNAEIRGRPAARKAGARKHTRRKAPKLPVGGRASESEGFDGSVSRCGAARVPTGKDRYGSKTGAPHRCDASYSSSSACAGALCRRHAETPVKTMSISLHALRPSRIAWKMLSNLFQSFRWQRPRWPVSRRVLPCDRKKFRCKMQDWQISRRCWQDRMLSRLLDK